MAKTRYFLEDASTRTRQLILLEEIYEKKHLEHLDLISKPMRIQNSFYIDEEGHLQRKTQRIKYRSIYILLFFFFTSP